MLNQRKHLGIQRINKMDDISKEKEVIGKDALFS